MRTAAGGYGDWAGKGAAILAVALGVGLVRGKAWTQLHTALATTAAVMYLISRLD
jgi:hypothetical protein